MFETGKCASGEQFCFIASISLAKEISLIKKVLNLCFPYFTFTWYVAMLFVIILGFSRWEIYSALQDYLLPDWPLANYQASHSSKICQDMSKNYQGVHGIACSTVMVTGFSTYNRSGWVRGTTKNFHDPLYITIIPWARFGYEVIK